MKWNAYAKKGYKIAAVDARSTKEVEGREAHLRRSSDCCKKAVASAVDTAGSSGNGEKNMKEELCSYG